MNPHTDKQLETAFRMAFEANLGFLDGAEKVERNWVYDKEQDLTASSCSTTTNIVRALLYMMGSDPDVHVDDIKWYALLENGDVVRMKNEGEKIPGTVAVKKVQKGDKE